MGGGTGGNFGNTRGSRERKQSSVVDNAKSMKKDYKLTPKGYFGEKGKNCRIIKTENPLKTAADFYEKISHGGVQKLLSNGKGIQTIFEDGSRIVYRIKTSTPGSPAIDISISIFKGIAKQKIHFIK